MLIYIAYEMRGTIKYFYKKICGANTRAYKDISQIQASWTKGSRC